MRKRRLTIVAFLAVAVLVMGVGFAQLTGNLMVSGIATFTGQTMAQSQITNLLKFKSVTTDACEATFDGQDATMTVKFHDTTGTQDTFTATAVFTITYGIKDDGSTDTSLPDLALGAIVNTSVVPTETDTKGTFTVTPVWTDAAGTTDGGTAQQTIKTGSTVYMKVTVTYTKPTGVDVSNNSFDATIGVKIPWATIDA